MVETESQYVFKFLLLFVFVTLPQAWICHKAKKA